MNYLAHLALSGTSEEVTIGNFIADHLRGKQANNFNSAITKGIMLHRVIDAYTDMHPIVKMGVARLKPKYKRYSSVIIDLFYDHFLYSRFNFYYEERIENFIFRRHSMLRRNYHRLPEKSKEVLTRMIQYDWLKTYGTTEGMERIFHGLSKRATFESKMEFAVKDLVMHYEVFEHEFIHFYDDITAYIKRLNY
jgi:acyl carrier protein phosphodiesterase